MIEYIKHLNATLNPPRGVKMLRSVLEYLEEGDVESARNVAKLDCDKLYQYGEVTYYTFRRVMDIQDPCVWCTDGYTVGGVLCKFCGGKGKY